MSLPFDYARCVGTTSLKCQGCRRREMGHPYWQSYIAPAIDLVTGKCSNFIEPPQVITTNGTTPPPTRQGKD